MNKPFLPLSREDIAIRALGLKRDPLAGELIALEPRMVFDGAGLAVATDAAKQASDTSDASKTDASKSTVDAAADQLARTRVTASRPGLALFASRKDWEGRPVSTGERIMQIAAPERVQLRIDMPVKDAPLVRDQARVRIYLDSDPLNPLNAVLERATYHATPMPGGGLAFVLYAKLPEGEAPRIGYRGTAQVFGDNVALIYYVFRRPLTALRQMVGL